jgi:LmbE family N-acetylglucosaminyl deacetylase
MGLTRRGLLTGAGRLAVGLAAGGSASQVAAAGQGSSQNLDAAKLKVVVAGGHPGDPEYGCGGTVARFTALGCTATLLYLNDGAWPPTPASERLAEAKKACEILKAGRLYAGQQNGHAIVDNAHYEEFAKLLLAEKPDAVFTQWPIDNHRDHRAITALVYDAWRHSERKFALYYYEVSNGEDTLQFSPTHYVDITGTEPRKRAACYAHASQTPDRYYELQDDVAKFRGIESGYLRAEAFVLQTQSPFDVLAALRRYWAWG